MTEALRVSRVGQGDPRMCASWRLQHEGLCFMLNYTVSVVVALCDSVVANRFFGTSWLCWYKCCDAGLLFAYWVSFVSALEICQLPVPDALHPKLNPGPGPAGSSAATYESSKPNCRNQPLFPKSQLQLYNFQAVHAEATKR